MSADTLHCHICTREITGDEGDICARCGKDACPEHMVIVLTQGKGRMAVCTKCLNDDDRIENLYHKTTRPCRIC